MSDESIEPAVERDETDVTDEQDEDGKPVRVIRRARLVDVSLVDPRQQHVTDPRRRHPE